MHARNIIKIRFDPKKSENPEIRKIFENHKATVLWCCIKNNHITSQYFNETILETVELLNEKGYYPKYHDFLNCCFKLTRNFGKVPVTNSNIGPGLFEIDHEYWSDIYKMVYLKTPFKLEIILDEEKPDPKSTI